MDKGRGKAKESSIHDSIKISRHSEVWRKLAPSVTDPLHGNSTTRQSSPISIAGTFQPILLLQLLIHIPSFNGLGALAYKKKIIM